MTKRILKFANARTLAAACVTIVTLSVGFTPGAYAQCGPSRALKLHMPLTPRPSLMAIHRTDTALRPNSSTNVGPTAIPTMVGLWDIVFTSGGQVVDEGFDTWHSDGTETLNDTPPPSTGNVCLGIWERVVTPNNTFKLYHPSWTFDANGNLNGTAIIQETVTVANNNNSFSGTFTVDEYDLNNNLIFHLDGTVAASRITVP